MRSTRRWRARRTRWHGRTGGRGRSRRVRRPSGAGGSCRHLGAVVVLGPGGGGARLAAPHVVSRRVVDHPQARGIGSASVAVFLRRAGEDGVTDTGTLRMVRPPHCTGGCPTLGRPGRAASGSAPGAGRCSALWRPRVTDDGEEGIIGQLVEVGTGAPVDPGRGGPRVTDAPRQRSALSLRGFHGAQTFRACPVAVPFAFLEASERVP
jgi:hypothetical protein